LNLPRILNVLLKDRAVLELTQPHIKGTYKCLARVENRSCKFNPVDASEGILLTKSEEKLNIVTSATLKV
jgi:hypothetical protein